MNERQMKAARNEMSYWLKHPAELGRKPAKIECAGTLVLDGKTYYIFKYKKGLFGGEYMLGVCGGYEGDSLENDGCVWSEMEPFRKETAKKDAAALISLWKEYAQPEGNDGEEGEDAKNAPLLQFVLLKEPKFDKAALEKELEENWGIEDESGYGLAGEGGAKTPDALSISWRGANFFAMLMPTAIPNDEAQEAAKNNFFWPDGAKAVAEHRAHLVVTALRGEASAVDAGTGLVKVVAACCKVFGAIGVYANETVYEPRMYLHLAKKPAGGGDFPCWNLVWSGVCRGDAGGLNAYTCGLNQFGFDEIEVLNSRAKPSELVDFLCAVATYVVTQNVRLTDGSKVGAAGKKPYVASQSPGVNVEGDSIKFEF